MLNLSNLKDVGKVLGYYSEALEVGREVYYPHEGQVLGRWLGSSAPAAGFVGAVETGSLERLLRGAGLRNPPREGAVVGVDLTFKAPKSVGVLWGVADERVARQLGEAHDAAVTAALGSMEREACPARRGAGGVIQVRGGGFIADGFHHASSRADDPLLHTYVVLANLTLGPNGKWTTLDGRHLHRQAKAGGYLYQAELRREITERLRLKFGPVEEGCAYMAGFSRPLIKHFWRRQEEMLEHMAEHGGHPARSADIAVLETRRAKNDLALKVLRERWVARAQGHGLDQAAVERILDAGGWHVQLELDAGLPQAGSIVDVLSVKTRTFGRPELSQALAAAQPHGASVIDIEKLASQVLADHEVVVLPIGKAPAGLTGPRFTTRAMLAVEQAGAKLVLVGDDLQLPELHAAGAFHALAERLPACELHEVRRQREAWDRAALDQLRSGEVEQWVRAYRDHGRVTVGASHTATRYGLLSDWARAGGVRLMIAARREDVRDLNGRAGARLRAEEQMPLQEVVTAGRGFAVGDQEVGTINDRRAGILNGRRGTIVSAEPGADHLNAPLTARSSASARTTSSPGTSTTATQSPPTVPRTRPSIARSSSAASSCTASGATPR